MQLKTIIYCLLFHCKVCYYYFNNIAFLNFGRFTVKFKYFMRIRTEFIFLSSPLCSQLFIINPTIITRVLKLLLDRKSYKLNVLSFNLTVQITVGLYQETRLVILKVNFKIGIHTLFVSSFISILLPYSVRPRAGQTRPSKLIGLEGMWGLVIVVQIKITLNLILSLS